MSARLILTKTLVVALLLSAVQPAHAAEPLANRVKETLDKGINYLESKQSKDRNGDWNWENSEFLNQAWSGGTSCLATLALLTAGVKVNDKYIQRTLPYVRGLKPTQTYVVALQSMVLAEIGEAKDLNIIQNNVNFLLEGRIYRGKDKDRVLTGWSYGKDGHIEADNSNTQYALLGLLAGRQAGVKIAKEDWDEIQKFYIRTIRIEQLDKNSGGWPYRPDAQNDSPSHTMTCAGLSGLFISSLETNSDKQKLDEKTGIAANCGQYEENEAVAKGMKWLGKNFNFDMSRNPHRATFYNVYGIERVGRLSGQRFIGEHDWYREGCELLCGVKHVRVKSAGRRLLAHGHRHPRQHAGYFHQFRTAFPLERPYADPHQQARLQRQGQQQIRLEPQTQRRPAPGRLLRARTCSANSRWPGKFSTRAWPTSKPTTS